jgi:hypothetical protein
MGYYDVVSCHTNYDAPSSLVRGVDDVRRTTETTDHSTGTLGTYLPGIKKEKESRRSLLESPTKRGFCYAPTR